MKAHRRRIVFLGMLVLAFFIAILSLRGMGLAANAPNQGKESATSSTSSLSGSSQITITAAGFAPAVLTVTVGTEVTWYNGTGVTHILRFGTPHRIFLPLLMKNGVGGSGLAARGAEPIPRTTGFPLEGSESSSAALPPGGTSTHRFISTGVYPYFLATAPQFSGQVIVQERPPAPGITGGEKPVVPVYQQPLDDPVGLAVNAAETVAYVVEKGAGRLVTVDIDPTSPTYRAITPIASGLEDLQMGLALDPSETYAYVTENEPGTLKRVTLATGQVVTITDALQYPHDVVLSSDGVQAYVTLSAGALVRVNVTTGQVFTVTTDLYHPAGVALLPGDAEALVCEVGRGLQRVDLTTGGMTELELPGYAPSPLRWIPVEANLTWASPTRPTFAWWTYPPAKWNRRSCYSTGRLISPLAPQMIGSTSCGATWGRLSSRTWTSGSPRPFSRHFTSRSAWLSTLPRRGPMCSNRRAANSVELSWTLSHRTTGGRYVWRTLGPGWATGAAAWL